MNGKVGRTAQEGSPAKFCAQTTLAAARIVRVLFLMLMELGG